MADRGGESSSAAGADASGATSSSSKRKRPSEHTAKANSGSSRQNDNRKNANKHKKSKRSRRAHYRPPQVDHATLPRFLDSTGAVTAGTFSARRLPEMKSLWRSYLENKHAEKAAADAGVSQVAEACRLDDSWNYRSGGRKASDRHLRRRTGSHHSRRRHRFPNGLPATDGGGTSIKGSEKDGVGGTVEDAADTKIDGRKRPCRRARRKPAALRAAHRGWQTQPPSESSSSPPASPTCTASTNWVETHLWHTKRFHMSPPMFGWSIPLVHAGRGTAAALRLAHDNCTVQDATWSIDGGATTLSSSSVSDLIAVLGRVCGRQAEFLADELVLSGLRWGGGTIHRLGAYPLGVIGPARFLFCRRNDEYCVGIFVHPAIRGDVVSVVADAAAESDVEVEGNVKVDQIESGVALVQVRGTRATEAIKRSLQPTSRPSRLPGKTSISFGWEKIGSSPRSHRTIPHGTVIPVDLDPILMGSKGYEDDQTSPARDDATEKVENDILSYVEGLSEYAASIAVKDILPASYFSSDGGSCFSMLISHRPQNVNSQLKHNAAVCGWDILCSPGIANDIFLSLNHSGTCAIGLAEEASAALEAEPPIPIFPRDYPDTACGQTYWSGRDTEWNVVRCCLEHGATGGRFKTQLKRIMKAAVLTKGNANAEAGKDSSDADGNDDATTDTKSSWYSPFRPIPWSSITTPNAEDEHEGGTVGIGSAGDSVEVVRGAYGAPFVQALHDSGHFVIAEHNEGRRRKRRPHRRVRPPQEAVQSNPLARDAATRHKNMCQTLLSSLSLPAMLRCHVYVEGRGTFDPQATIYQYAGDVEVLADDCFMLGCVVSGAFSTSRGSFHGTAFVGAIRFLQSFLSNPSGNTVSVMDPTGGEGRTVALRVSVKGKAHGTVPRTAMLTLML